MEEEGRISIYELKDNLRGEEKRREESSLNHRSPVSSILLDNKEKYLFDSGYDFFGLASI